MDNKIQKYLIESLRQDNDYYQNKIEANHPYPCGICQKNVGNNQKAVYCNMCELWIHIKCNGTTNEEYNQLIDENINNNTSVNKEWHCKKCTIINRAQIFPFGLESDYDISGINNSDSMETFNLLPNFDLTTEAAKIDSLSQQDLAENFINNINSKYYSVKEFNTLKINKSLKLFHTNLNGLEHKLQTLDTFINGTSNIDFDIINISETSQLEGETFINNVKINGYKPPFTKGSKSNRGGVAIYVKTNLTVIERSDLNLLDNNFEAQWIEIINKTTKNIICGCFYRHPSSDIDIFTNYLAKCVQKINKEKKECYLSGDFNIDLLKYESSNKHSTFLNTLTSSGFLPHILQPTRITEDTATIIDNIYANKFTNNSTSGNILIQMADHLAQFLIINKEPDKIKTKENQRN